MTNPFRKPEKPEPEWILVEDNPSGRRIILECQKCFLEVFEGKYYFDKKELLFVCPRGHENAVEIDGLQL